MQLKLFYNITTKVNSRKKCYYSWWSTWLIMCRPRCGLMLDNKGNIGDKYSICNEIDTPMCIIAFSSCGFIYDDVIKWEHFPRFWPFVRGIHRSPVRLNKRLNKPSRCRWFETPSRSPWRHCNVSFSCSFIWSSYRYSLGRFAGTDPINTPIETWQTSSPK